MHHCAYVPQQLAGSVDDPILERVVYPTYSFYKFDERAVMALYSNTAVKKSIPAFEITTDWLLGKFLATDIEDLKKECRRRAPEELEAVIRNAAVPPS